MMLLPRIPRRAWSSYGRLSGSQTLSHVEDLRIAVNPLRKLDPGRAVELHHARNVQMCNFRQGKDFLIVCGRRANPWADLFEPLLNARWNSAIRPERLRSEIRTCSGRTARYVTYHSKRQTGIAYARIALVPGSGEER